MIWLLLETGQLAIWHIYAVNVVSGLMNTVQQPASEVAVTRILPKQFYQKVGGLQYLSNAVNSVLTPVITTAILRLHIPEFMQGRIYAVRNAFQFFTIPVNYLIGGFAMDYIFELLMAAQNNRFLIVLFGTGKGSDAALFFFVIAFLGVGICLYFRRNPSLWELGDKTGR